MNRFATITGFFVVLCAGTSLADWINVTSNLANMPSECGNLCLLSAVPGKDKVIASIAQKGLWATTDGGANWTALGTGAGSAVITNRGGNIVYDPNNADIFWEAGIYNGGGVYKTVDGGITFTQLGAITRNDNVTVDFTDPGRKTLLASGHETLNALNLSTDGGQNWADIGSHLPPNSSFSRPYIINTTTFLVGCSGYNGTLGMFRSTDGGATFVSVGGAAAAQGPSLDPLVLPNGTILWELIYNRGMIRSSDQGLNWSQITIGGYMTTVHPIQLPDGRVVTAGTRHNLVISSDAAGPNATATWTAIGTTIPFQPLGVVFDSARSAFFVWYNDCNGVVLPNAIQRWDYSLAVRQPPAISARGRRGRAATITLSGLAGPGSDGVAYDLRGTMVRTAARARSSFVTIVSAAPAGR